MEDLHTLFYNPDDEEEWEDALSDLFDDLDPDDEIPEEDPVFGRERRLLPGERKFLDEFIDGMKAVNTILCDRIIGIDRLARTSNISCREKCDKIRDLCDDAMDNSSLIDDVIEELLKVIRKEHSEEYCNFIIEEIEARKMSGADSKL